MSTTIPITTADELFRMPDDGYRYELIEGRLIKMSPAGYEHGVIAVRLTRLLANHVESEKLGQVTAAETGFMLARDPDTVRAPDAAFIRAERITPEALPKAFWPGAPDLAVEVLSPGDTVESMEERISDWLDHGCSLVWVVSPKLKTVTVYRSKSDIEILTNDDVLGGGDVVRGFECTVQEIFETS